MKQVTLREYDYLIIGDIKMKPIEGRKRRAHHIGDDAFKYLSRMLAKEENKENSDDHGLFLKRCSWTNGKPAFQVQSYVGVLQTPCGTQIEILPKISDSSDDGDEQSRKTLLRMLRYLKKANFKLGGDAHLHKSPMHLLELFMLYFLREVNILVKRGIRSDYVTKEENQAFLKGKLLVKEQVRVNAVQQQRFFCAYDEYEPNRPENRLIHAALVKVSKLSRRNAKIQRLCRELMFVFADVPISQNIRQDFSKCKSNRAMTHYQHPLEWCRLILNEESTVPSAGVTQTISILFPMEKIFEDYVAAMLSKSLQKDGYIVKTQVQQQYLCKDILKRKNKFQLRPDILITKADQCWVADTKWKTINQHEENKNYGISQSDMYQLYAYGHKYRCKGLFLIYPKTMEFDKPLDFCFDEERWLKCYPFDCVQQEARSNEDSLTEVLFEDIDKRRCTL